VTELARKPDPPNDERNADALARRRAEEELARLRARLAGSFDRQELGRVVLDGGGLVRRANAAFAAMIGATPAELTGRALVDLAAPEDREAVGAALWRATIGPEPERHWWRRYVHRYEHGTRGRVWLDGSFAQLDPDRDDWVATYIDVDAHQRAEVELRMLHTAVEQSPASVVITDRDGAIQYVNAKFCRVTGYTAEEARGLNPRVLKSGRTAPSVYRELWETIARGEIWHGQLCNKRKDGSLYWENVSISPVRDPKGVEITHYIAVKEDVSERRLLEAQLAQAQKLEAVGQLAAGIAHEINTPTQFASDSVRFLDEALGDLLAVVDAHRRAAALAPDDPARAEALEAVAAAEERADLDYLREQGPRALTMTKEGLGRIAQIVRAMREFSHPNQGQQAPADLNAALESTLTIAKNEYKYVADVERDYGELPPVMCLVGELNQVFLNLIVNAAHAIQSVVEGTKARGTIRLATRRDGEHVVVRISDTGCGVPVENRARLFEPFFTTKAVGKGTGQGLTIARSIVVQKHQGELSFESEEGRGSTFEVRLPIAGRTRESGGPKA
jgi:two-component system NtrC family sensor kinase